MEKNAIIYGQEFEYCFIEDKGYLELEVFKGPRLNPLSFDFSSQLYHHQQMNYSKHKEPLAKAMGFAKNPNPHIIDLTLGSAGDALILLSMGARVTGIEMNPVIFRLLENALERAQMSKEQSVKEMSSHLTIVHDHSMDFLEQTDETFDVAYLDPMFELSEKKSLPPKKMQIMRDLISHTPFFDAKIICLAKEHGVRRVVIKRPLKGKELFPGVVGTVKGKTVRYDIY